MRQSCSKRTHAWHQALRLAHTNTHRPMSKVFPVQSITLHHTQVPLVRTQVLTQMSSNAGARTLPLHAACHRINQRTVAVMCLCRLPVASSQWHSRYICSTTLHVPVRTNRPCTRHTCMTSGQGASAGHDNRQQERALQPHTTTRLLQTLCPA